MRVPIARAVLVCIATFTSHATLAEPLVPKGTPIDDKYREEFARCDKFNKFEMLRLPYFETLKSGKTKKWFGCMGNPSLFTRFEKISGQAGKPTAIITESKVAHDRDGSTKACTDPGSTDTCETALLLYPDANNKCVVKPDRPHGPCVPASADVVPYVVIPGAGPKDVQGLDARKFQHKTNLRVGDYGVMIFKGRVAGVIVGDIGPFNKMGEGATALLKKLSNGKTIDSGAIAILFPGTRDSLKSLSPSSLPDVVRTKGCGYYQKLAGKAAAVGCH
jgi:hypothetical protein